jgi:hypothetical protein
MSIKINASIDDKFIGVPYKLGGKEFSGADCIGICILWLKEQGYEYEYDDGMGKILYKWYQTAPKRFVNAVLNYGNVVQWPEIRKYDVLLFFGVDEICKFPTMMGVMIDDRHFLSSLGDNRTSSVQILDINWKSKFWGAIRLHKVTENGS